MRLASVLMNGLVFEAELVSAGEGRVIRLETDEILSPDHATLGEFAIVEATDAERTALREAGYDLTDYAPPAPGCPSLEGSLGQKFDA